MSKQFTGGIPGLLNDVYIGIPPVLPGELAFSFSFLLEALRSKETTKKREAFS